MADFWDRFRGILRASKVFGGGWGGSPYSRFCFLKSLKGLGLVLHWRLIREWRIAAEVEVVALRFDIFRLQHWSLLTSKIGHIFMNHGFRSIGIRALSNIRFWASILKYRSTSDIFLEGSRCSVRLSDGRT